MSQAANAVVYISKGLDRLKLIMETATANHRTSPFLTQSSSSMTKSGTYCDRVPKCRICPYWPTTPTGRVWNIPGSSTNPRIMIPHAVNYPELPITPIGTLDIRVFYCLAAIYQVLTILTRIGC